MKRRLENRGGISLAWIGAQATTAEDVQAMLGLTDTGSSGHYYDFPVVGLAIPNDWYLLAAKRCGHAIRSDPILSHVSARTSIIACSVEEHVMFMLTALWREGRKVWAVQHRGSDYGETDLVVERSPPEPFEYLRARCFAAQRSVRDAGVGVDYVADIPLELARSIVGFKYDAINPGIEDTRFRALRLEPDGRLAKAERRGGNFGNLEL